MRVPTFPVPGLTKWLTDYVTDRERRENRFLVKDTENHHVLLSSPNGKVWEVTVLDTGVLKVTQIG